MEALLPSRVPMPRSNQRKRKLPLRLPCSLTVFVIPPKLLQLKWPDILHLPSKAQWNIFSLLLDAQCLLCLLHCINNGNLWMSLDQYHLVLLPIQEAAALMLQPATTPADIPPAAATTKPHPTIANTPLSLAATDVPVTSVKPVSAPSPADPPAVTS